VIANDFDLLDELSLKSDAEIQKLVSPDLLAALDRIEAQLRTHPNGNVDNSNLGSRIRNLKALRRLGSNALGEAILEASELADHRQLLEARDVYTRFIANCDSPLYREIAEQQLKKLLAK